MKRHLLILLMALISIYAFAEKVDGNINFISPGTYQLAYNNQVIFIYFNKSKIPGSNNFIRPADLNEQERYAIVNTFKEQIDLLPEDFIEEYLNIDLYPYHIFGKNDYGFYYENQVVVDVDKIKPGLSYKESISTALMNEMAHIFIQRKFRDDETKAIKAYLNEFYNNHRSLLQNIESSTYECGFVSQYAAGEIEGGYSATEEIKELFSHLICLESRERLDQYFASNTGSILEKKVTQFIEYLGSISASFDHTYFFGEPKSIEIIHENPPLIVDGVQLLAMHEMKSNETYGFSSEDVEENFETSTDDSMSNFDNFESFTDDTPAYNATIEEDQVETIFNPNTNKKSNSKKKKTKRKKDGSGLLLVGGLLYLTLELLSQ